MTLIPWLLLILPLVSAATITLFTRRWSMLSALISVGSACITLVLAFILYFGPEPAEPIRFYWLDFGETFKVPFGVIVDHLSRSMMLVVTVVGSLVHVYSLGYMADDEGKSRYFAGLSLFMFSMTGIVLSDNFVMMFIFWELVGISSYILIGHWFTKAAPPAAANKAFLVNRIGDFGFMLGILLVWTAAGSVVFSEIEPQMGAISTNSGFLTTAALLVFCGAVGKSAQVPLHVWLPDAMEGPTPVSALIHAATMVAAGVYMLARVFFLVGASPDALQVITWVGTITCFFAALMATQQDDIKRILAYSTLSQLGYMVMGIGVGSGEAAMFHLFTHAFFKSLLFLGAGAVIYGMHHEQNIWKMGALRKRMPFTFLPFLIATLALSGCLFFSGSYSKDTILAIAWEHNRPASIIGIITAGLTAFYMFRLVTVVFFGEAKSDAAKEAHEAPLVMKIPLLILAVPALAAGYKWFGGIFIEIPHHPPSETLIMILATIAFLCGAAGAWFLYAGKAKDPIHIPLFAKKFYVDEAYAYLIRFTQDLLASASAWFDRWILDSGIVRGSAAGVWGLGFVLRFFQVGNIQAYAFLFGLGIVGLLYFVLTR